MSYNSITTKDIIDVFKGQGKHPNVPMLTMKSIVDSPLNFVTFYARLFYYWRKTNNKYIKDFINGERNQQGIYFSNKLAVADAITVFAPILIDNASKYRVFDYTNADESRKIMAGLRIEENRKEIQKRLAKLYTDKEDNFIGLFDRNRMISALLSLISPAGNNVPFKTYDAAQEYLKKLVNSTISPAQIVVFFITICEYLQKMNTNQLYNYRLEGNKMVKHVTKVMKECDMDSSFNVDYFVAMIIGMNDSDDEFNISLLKFSNNSGNFGAEFLDDDLSEIYELL